MTRINCRSDNRGSKAQQLKDINPELDRKLNQLKGGSGAGTGSGTGSAKSKQRAEPTCRASNVSGMPGVWGMGVEEEHANQKYNVRKTMDNARKTGVPKGGVAEDFLAGARKAKERDDKNHVQHLNLKQAMAASKRTSMMPPSSDGRNTLMPPGSHERTTRNGPSDVTNSTNTGNSGIRLSDHSGSGAGCARGGALTPKSVLQHGRTETGSC